MARWMIGRSITRHPSRTSVIGLSLKICPTPGLSRAPRRQANTDGWRDGSKPMLGSGVGWLFLRCSFERAHRGREAAKTRSSRMMSASFDKNMYRPAPESSTILASAIPRTSFCHLVNMPRLARYA